jgi:hypothetical protein
MCGSLPILGNNELKNENKVLGVIVAIRVVCEDTGGMRGYGEYARIRVGCAEYARIRVGYGRGVCKN